MSDSSMMLEEEKVLLDNVEIDISEGVTPEELYRELEKLIWDIYHAPERDVV